MPKIDKIINVIPVQDYYEFQKRILNESFFFNIKL